MVLVAGIFMGFGLAMIWAERSGMKVAAKMADDSKYTARFVCRESGQLVPFADVGSQDKKNLAALLMIQSK